MSMLDLTTLTCPWPIIKTKQAMDQLNTGENLLIMVSDPSFTIDCQVFVKQSGHKLLSSWDQDKSTCYLLQK